MKNWKRYYLFVIFLMWGCFFFIQYHHEAEAKKKYQQSVKVADEIYSGGNYSLAIDAYSQLIELGYSDASVYFHLANSQFFLDFPGFAKANYLRALYLKPRNPDIKHNLSVVQQGLDGISRSCWGGKNILFNVACIQRQIITLDELVIIAFLLWCAMGYYFVQRLLDNEHDHCKQWFMVCFLFFGITLMLLINGVYVKRNYIEAININKEEIVHDGPGVQYENLLTLSEGTELMVVNKLGSWMEISLGDQTQIGWIKADSVEVINQTRLPFSKWTETIDELKID